MIVRLGRWPPIEFEPPVDHDNCATSWRSPGSSTSRISGPVTTVTFEEKGGKTLLVLHDLYPSKEALDAAGTGAADAMVETFAQLDQLLVTLGASVGRS